jgi:adenine-specific DNA-methyltransferase
MDLMKREVLKLDLADLDFGIYRILNHRRAEIEAFFDKELPDLLDEAISGEGERRRTELTRQLEELRASLEEAAADLGYDSVFQDGLIRAELGSSPKAKRYIETEEAIVALEEGEVFSGSEEDRLYNALYTFFSRYYRDGDFQPQQRRARQARYSVPYNGEDVHFHWRSKGSHYVKTTEELKSYSFHSGGWKVRFELVEAFQEPDNVKGSARYFIPVIDHAGPSDDDPTVFRVPFDLRRLTAEEDKRWIKQTDDIDGASTQERIINDIGPQIDTPDGVTKKDLLRHLHRYARKNRTDYFVHPQLGEFLRAELDFYLKNEFLAIETLTDIATATDRIAKLQVLRHVAGRMIDLLDEIESFQAKLFEKRRLVVSSSYLVPLEVVPRYLWPEVVANSHQADQWAEELALEIDDLSDLDSHRALFIDTSLFPASFTSQVLSSIEDLDAALTGVVIKGENYGALRTVSRLLAGNVDFVYIDPPYNTGSDDFLYVDDFSRHSTWLTMLEERVRLGLSLLKPTGTMAVSIDDTELHRLKELAVRQGTQELATLVWDRNRKNDSRFFSVGHEYMLVVAKDAERLREGGVRFREPREGLPEARVLFEGLISEHGDDWAAIRSGWLSWLDNMPLSDPRRRMRRFSKVGPRGPYRDDGDASWPGGGGPRYEVLHPETNKSVRIPSRGWVFPTPERFWQEYESGRLVFGPDETTTPSIARYLFESEGQVMPSVHYSYAQTAAQEFDNIFGRRVFDNPKNFRDIARLVRYLSSNEGWVVDYFAGSGTTGHAVMHVNRQDETQRRFVLVDMGEHVDSVLLPRLRKIFFSPAWTNGHPDDELSEIEHKPPLGLVLVIRLESFEDCLNSLDRGENELGPEYRIRYAIPDSVDDSPTWLPTERLEEPFEFRLDVHRENGVESIPVDLVTTFNLMKGIRPKRYKELDHDNRRYVVIEGIDQGEEVLVLWRSVKNLDPESEKEYLAAQLPAILGNSLADYARIYHNADSALPNSVSLDAEFKHLMFEPEPPLS